ncbi:MAG: NAD(P)/FAD-dependent oxidoreductase [Candidatus Hodarchaeota archaeon]
MYDVVISGAGPSGSQCAEVLTKAGYKVALLEKDITWRKPCGGAINRRVLNFYPKLRKLDLPKIQGISIHSADFHELEYEVGEKSRGSVIDRLDLDNLMRNMAVDSGAELFNKNISVDFIRKNQKKIGILTKSLSGKKEYFGNILILADGMSSKLAIKSGIRKKWRTGEIANGKCAIIEGKHNLDESFIYIYFMPYKGYGWIFPLDYKRFNIGVYTFGEDNLSYNLDKIYHEFLQNHNIKKLIPDSNYKTFWSGAYPFPTEGVLVKSLYDDNLILIGDTAGFVSPISGEGIQTALSSGNVAADTAIKALELEDYSKNSLKLYKSHPDIKKIVKSFKLKRAMRQFFYANKGEDLNKLLELTENDEEFKGKVINLFMSRDVPVEEIFSRLK